MSGMDGFLAAQGAEAQKSENVRERDVEEERHPDVGEADAAADPTRDAAPHPGAPTEAPKAQGRHRAE
jgi:hypothetical protein